MLQQTQVKTVIPYYHRWLQEFPTIHAVAEAPLDAIIKQWEGLGYYARCRNFYTAAQMVRDKNDGNIPMAREEFRQLPGVGDYTANMVLSIVCREPLPALDGNLQRIGYRLLGLKRETPYNQRRVEKYFTTLIDRNRPGDFNQALMDLGSDICRAREVSCHRCPLKQHCTTAGKSNPLDYPQLRRQKEIPHRHVFAGFIQSGDKFLVRRRAEKLLHGLWELPAVFLDYHRDEDLIKEKMETHTGYQLNYQYTSGTITHQYSHFILTATLFHYRLSGVTHGNDKPNQRWITRDEIQEYAFHKASHKLFSLLDSSPAHDA